MLYTILKSINNFFVTNSYRERAFKVEGGLISLDFIKDGQYFLIEGSVLNDGVYKYPATELVDEEFNGRITGLAIPKDFLELAAEIEVYREKHGERTGLTSESFGGYSYTKATTGNGTLADWQDAYRQRLNAWRKI